MAGPERPCPARSGHWGLPVCGDGLCGPSTAWRLREAPSQATPSLFWEHIFSESAGGLGSCCPSRVPSWLHGGDEDPPWAWACSPGLHCPSTLQATRGLTRALTPLSPWGSGSPAVPHLRLTVSQDSAWRLLSACLPTQWPSIPAGRAVVPAAARQAASLAQGHVQTPRRAPWCKGCQVQGRAGDAQVRRSPVDEALAPRPCPWPPCVMWSTSDRSVQACRRPAALLTRSRQALEPAQRLKKRRMAGTGDRFAWSSP